MRQLRGNRMRWLAVASAGLATLAASSAPAAAARVNPLLAKARLDGQFLLAGRVTKARNVPGEHKGQTVTRTWTFAATCRAGPCSSLHLTRARQSGTDQLVLTRTSPGTYTGSGSFYSPLRCGGQIFRRGEQVPFRVKVMVTATAGTGSGVYATRVSATYTNRRRINRTRCVASLGSDAVTYHGHLL